MNKIEYFYIKLLKSNVAIFVICVLLFFCLRIPIENLLNQTIVNHILCYIESTWYNDITFIIIVMFIIFNTLININKHKPSFSIVLTLLALSTIYLFYRITNSTWEYKSLFFFEGLKYFDLIIIYTIHLVTIYFLEIEKKINSESDFYDDQPLGNNNSDLLGYESYAVLLSDKIMNSNFKGSFAIGINGKWGLGKTSFIDLVKRNLIPEEIIQIDYNPWNSSTPNAIIKDFFNSIKEKLSPFNSSITNLIIDYSNKLIENTNNSFIKSIPNDFFESNKNNSTYSLYNRINLALSKIGKKIIVYIDDLDRLDKDEIIEVIRLIRNTANFTNTIFIVAYDRNYIISALKHHNSFNQEEFLEKIFQLEISLPYFSKDILRFKLAENLKNKLPKEIHQEIDDSIIGTRSIVPVFLNEWLESIRDVTRLSNSIILNISKLVFEINFNDLVRIELLRLKYPSAYDLLYRRTDDFLDSSGLYQNDHYYHLKKISQEEQKISSLKDRNITNIFHQYLFQNHSELSIPLKDIEKVVNYVDSIFSSNRFSINTGENINLSIKNPSKFNRYFAYSLLKGNLSEIEYSKARSLEQESFNSKISTWIQEGLTFDLKSKFYQISSYDNTEDFEKIIRAIFHLATSLDTNNYNNFIGYDANDLVSKIIKGNSEKFLRDYYNCDKEKYKDFIKNIFVKAKSPYVFESDLIRFTNYNLYKDFPLNQNELKDISLFYFESYCNEIEMFDSNIWHLFHSCKQTIKENEINNSYTKREVFPVEAKKIFKKFVENKDIEGFLQSILESHYGPDKYIISKIVVDIYDSWNDFEQIINQFRDKNDFFKEFTEFYTKFAETSHSRYIDFEFKELKVKE